MFIDSNKELGRISILLMLVNFLFRMVLVTKHYRMPNSRTIGVKFWKLFAHNGNIKGISLILNHNFVINALLNINDN